MIPDVAPLQIHLKQPFRIAHGTSTVRTNAVVRIGSAYGEAGLPPYLDTTAAEVVQWISGIDIDPGLHVPAIHHLLAGLPEGPSAARCALDMALHDLWGRRIGRPLHELFGLDPVRHSPVSFVTLSIPESLDDLREAAAAFGPTDRLKLKAGSGDLQRDLEVARIARESTRALIAVDANGGWSIPETVSALPRLFELDITFVEQPISNRDPEDWHLLRRLLPHSGIPLLFADESVFTADDIIMLAGAVDGVNLKLAKCGGIAPARAMISVARALDLRVMLGCMIESSLAIAAAAHLAPLADYVDLDAGLLIRDDPFDGVILRQGRVLPTDRPGIGAIPIGPADLFAAV